SRHRRRLAVQPDYPIDAVPGCSANDPAHPLVLAGRNGARAAKKVEGSCPLARCNPFPWTPGRGSLLPVQRLGGMTDATAGVHRWARERGGVAFIGASAAGGDAGSRVSRLCIG